MSETAIHKRECIVVLTILMVLGLIALRPSIRGNDGVGHFVYCASILTDGDLDFSDEYAQFDAARQYEYRFGELPKSHVTGLPSNRYGVGAALMWGPFVAVAHLAAPAGAMGIERGYEWAVGIGTAFWATLGLWLLYARLRREFGVVPCAATLAGLVFATPLGFYMYAHGSMSHGVGFFAMTLALLAFAKAWHRPRWLPMLGAGAALALVFIVRFQDATWTMLLGLLLAGRCARQIKSGPANSLYALAALVAGGVLVLLPQLLAWQILYGSFLSGPTPYLDDSAGSFAGWPRHGLSVLFSERGGVLAWHPLMAAGLVGLAAVWVKRRGLAEGGEMLRLLAGVGLAGFAAQWWLVGCWSVWWAGASFGNRFFISALPFLAIGIARLLHRADGRVGWGRLAMLAVLILWNFGLLIQYATEMTPREDAVGWGRVIRQNLIDVPHWVWRRVT